MKKLLTVFIMYVFLTPLFACESGHWIKSISSDGSVIVLEDNTVWEIDSIDTINSALWLPIENILVCDDELINSDNGDKVSATQLR